MHWGSERQNQVLYGLYHKTLNRESGVKAIHTVNHSVSLLRLVTTGAARCKAQFRGQY